MYALYPRPKKIKYFCSPLCMAPIINPDHFNPVQKVHVVGALHIIKIFGGYGANLPSTHSSLLLNTSFSVIGGTQIFLTYSISDRYAHSHEYFNRPKNSSPGTSRSTMSVKYIRTGYKIYVGQTIRTRIPPGRACTIVDTNEPISLRKNKELVLVFTHSYTKNRKISRRSPVIKKIRLSAHHEPSLVI